MFAYETQILQRLAVLGKCCLLTTYYFTFLCGFLLSLCICLHLFVVVLHFLMVVLGEVEPPAELMNFSI